MGEFKTESIEFYSKDYVSNKNWEVCEFKMGQISFRSLWDENKNGRIQSWKQ